MSVEAAKAVYTFRGRTEVLSTGDTDLDERVHELTWLAVNEAFLEIKDPTSPNRIPLIKILVGRAAQTVGVHGQSEREELREMFMNNMENIRAHRTEDDDFDFLDVEEEDLEDA